MLVFSSSLEIPLHSKPVLSLKIGDRGQSRQLHEEVIMSDMIKLKMLVTIERLPYILRS